MNKSKKPSIRIKRAVKQLTEANPRYQIGNVLFEQIISLGIQEAKNQLKEIDPNKNYFVGPGMWQECIQILEKNLEL